MKKQNEPISGKSEVRKGLVQLRAHANLSDFAPLLFLFLALQAWFGILIQLVNSSGFTNIRMGTGFDKPIPTAEIAFYREHSKSVNSSVPGAVGQSDISDLLLKSNPEYVPDFLNFTFDTNPYLGWLFFVFVVAGCLIPVGYAVYGFLLGAIPQWCRGLGQILVVIAGVFWICAMYSTGIMVVNPVQSIDSASFWVMYGALCLHLFSDHGTRLRRYLPNVCLATVAFAVLTANGFNFSEIFYGSPAPFSPEMKQLNATALSGWWAGLNTFFRNPPSTVTWSIILLYVVMSVGFEFMKPQFTKINPFINLAIVSLSITALIFALVAMLGMRILVPESALGTQALLFVSGLFFLRYATSEVPTGSAVRDLIDVQLVKTEAGKT